MLYPLRADTTFTALSVHPAGTGYGVGLRIVRQKLQSIATNSQGTYERVALTARRPGGAQKHRAQRLGQTVEPDAADPSQARLHSTPQQGK